MKHLSKSLLIIVTLFITSTTTFAQTYYDGSWYSLYQSEFELETKISSFNGVQQDFSVFAPTAGQLQFDYLYVIWGGGLGSLSKVQHTHIYESTDGGNNKTEIATEEGKDTKNAMSANVSVSKNINYLLFDRPVGNTNTVKYTNVRVPLAYHILFAEGEYGTDTAHLTFEEKNIHETSEAQTIQLRSFYASNDITINCQHPEVFRIGSPDNIAGATWSVGTNACASTNGQENTPAGGNVLGDINQYPITIYFCPQNAIEYTDTIVITDGTSTATIAVTGKGLPIEQTITWDFNDTAMIVGDTIPLQATATSGLEVTFTITGEEGIVNIQNNQLIAIKEGSTTIVATQEGNTNYLATTSHTYTIDVANPTITGITDVTSPNQTAQKVLRNGKIYIIRNMHTYDILGYSVK